MLQVHLIPLFYQKIWKILIYLVSFHFQKRARLFLMFFLFASTQVNVVRCLSCPASASVSYNSPELLQRRNPPSQRSSTSGSISTRLRSSSPPPIAKSAGASSPANQITPRSTWLRQRGCTLVASLFYSTCYIYCPLSTRICSFSVSLKEKT